MIGLYQMGFFMKRAPGVPLARSDGTADVTLRPHRLLSNVEARGLVFLTGLSIHGQEQFVGDVLIDAYDCSFALAKKLDEEFLKSHGLEGKSDRAIQAWLDKRDMEMPGASVGRFTLPTIGKGQQVILRVQFGTAVDGSEWPFSLLGYAEMPEEA